MIGPVIVVVSLVLSYFVVTWILLGYWGQALMIGILASPIFSLTLLATSFVLKGPNWRAFWLANAILILIFGGLELYGLLTIKDNPATRFGGALLSVDGRVTRAGYASLVLDIAICVVSNFLGFFLSRVLIKRLNVQ
jgi:hypothetical protein